jgi:hypothetical protein
MSGSRGAVKRGEAVPVVNRCYLSGVARGARPNRRNNCTALDFLITTFAKGQKRPKRLHLPRVRSSSESNHNQREAACSLRAISGPTAPQQKACLLGGLPHLHNPRHSDCKGRATTGFALDRDVAAHHLTKPPADREPEASPTVFPGR